MVYTPYQSIGQGYANTQANALNPTLERIKKQRANLASRGSTLASDVSGLYDNASDIAGSVGTNIGNVGEGLMGAMAGIGSTLPGMDQSLLGNAARATGRAGATGSLLSSILGTQVSEARAAGIQGAQNRYQDEIRLNEDAAAGLETEQAKIRADWMTPASQRQNLDSNDVSIKTAKAQLAMLPLQQRAANLANMISMGQLDASILSNLAGMKALGLSQADMVKARKVYGGIAARRAGGSGGSAGDTPAVSGDVTFQ